MIEGDKLADLEQSIPGRVTDEVHLDESVGNLHIYSVAGDYSVGPPDTCTLRIQLQARFGWVMGICIKRISGAAWTGRGTITLNIVNQVYDGGTIYNTPFLIGYDKGIQVANVATSAANSGLAISGDYLYVDDWVRRPSQFTTSETAAKRPVMYDFFASNDGFLTLYLTGTVHPGAQSVEARVAILPLVGEGGPLVKTPNMEEGAGGFWKVQ